MAQTLEAAHQVLARVGIVESTKNFQNSHLTWSGWQTLTASVALIAPASSGARGSRCKHSTRPRRLSRGVPTRSLLKLLHLPSALLVDLTSYSCLIPVRAVCEGFGQAL